MNQPTPQARVGRTTRQLKRCIELARRGKIVFFAVADWDMVWTALKRCTALLDEQRLAHNFRKATRALDLHDAGEIRFVQIGDPAAPFTLETSGISQALRCVTFLVYDHHARYLIDRARRKASEAAA